MTGSRRRQDDFRVSQRLMVNLGTSTRGARVIQFNLRLEF